MASAVLLQHCDMFSSLSFILPLLKLRLTTF